jgi:hypothetical protein
MNIRKNFQSALSGIALTVLVATTSAIATQPQAANAAANAQCTITGFFCNGQMGGGSVPTGSNLPVIINPSFESGVLYMNVPNSFIQNGAQVQVSRAGATTETFSMRLNESGTRFKVGTNQVSTPSSIGIGIAIPRGIDVTLVVINPDGKVSNPVIFRRS